MDFNSNAEQGLRIPDYLKFDVCAFAMGIFLGYISISVYIC